MYWVGVVHSDRVGEYRIRINIVLIFNTYYTQDEVTAQLLSQRSCIECELTGAALSSTAQARLATRTAEAVRCYAPHLFSVQTGKEKLTLAKRVYVSGQLLSHSRPLLGQLVHVNFLTPVSCRVLSSTTYYQASF